MRALLAAHAARLLASCEVRSLEVRQLPGTAVAAARGPGGGRHRRFNLGGTGGGGVGGSATGGSGGGSGGTGGGGTGRQRRPGRRARGTGGAGGLSPAARRDLQRRSTTTATAWRTRASTCRATRPTAARCGGQLQLRPRLPGLPGRPVRPGGLLRGLRRRRPAAGQRLRVPVTPTTRSRSATGGQRLRRHDRRGLRLHERPAPLRRLLQDLRLRPGGRQLRQRGLRPGGLQRPATSTSTGCPGRLRIPLHAQRRRGRGVRRPGQRLRRHDRQQHHRRRRGLRRHARRHGRVPPGQPVCASTAP